MNNYYTTGCWCNKYHCWCEDVTFTTDNQNKCNGNCNDFVFLEKAKDEG